MGGGGQGAEFHQILLECPSWVSKCMTRVHEHNFADKLARTYSLEQRPDLVLNKRAANMLLNDFPEFFHGRDKQSYKKNYCIMM